MPKDDHSGSQEYRVASQTSEDCLLSGLGWDIKLIDGRYWLDYVSSELAGRAKIAEVTKADYELMRDEGMTFRELCYKYNLH